LGKYGQHPDEESGDIGSIHATVDYSDEENFDIEVELIGMDW
jgi:hypothetical protein